MARRRVRLRAIVQAYFNGLASRDLSGVPWAANATFYVPIKRHLLKGVACFGVRIVGRAKILAFLNPILPHLGEVKVVQYLFEGSWITTSTNIRFIAAPRVPFRVIDSFCVKKGRIVEHRIYFEPQRWFPGRRK